MKRFPQKELHFDKKELKTDLGSGNTIFVGSSCDMWAKEISLDRIQQILTYCGYNFASNTYVFQTKNPDRFNAFLSWPVNSVFGVTIETNRDTPCSKAPSPIMRKIAFENNYPFKKFVSIEPIMDFDLDILTDWIKNIKPQFVSIGADSGNNHLPEPSSDKLKALIESLKTITEVKLKDNLCRLLK